MRARESNPGRIGRAARLAACLAGTLLVSGCASTEVAAPGSATAATATPAGVASQTPATAQPATPAPTPNPAAFGVRTFVPTYAPDALFGVDAAGNTYLPGTTDGGALVKVDPSGTPIARWAGTGTLPGVPDAVGGVVVDPKTGDVWVTDMTADQVVHLSSDLVEQARWGTSGHGPGMLTQPLGIALDQKGDVVVVDAGNSRIETFTSDGAFVRSIATPHGAAAPTDIAVAADGTLLLSAAGARLDDGRVVRLKPDGSVVQPYRAETASWWFPDAYADVDGGALIADAWMGIVRLDADGNVVSKTFVPGSGEAPISARLAPSGSVYTLACTYQGSGCTLARLDPDGTGYTTAAKVSLPAMATPPGQMVTVDGHDLHVYCAGTGSPTVLWIPGNMQAGWGSASPYVLGRLAAFTRVCTVDRLETGFSDHPTGEEDMLHWMADLDDIHAALVAAGESGPYVTVGHSYGGLLARVFAYRYPTEVQGVVSIDPSHENQYDGPVPMPDGPASCTDASCPFSEDVQAVKQLTGGTVAGSLGSLPLVVISHDPALPYWDGAYDDYWLQLGADTATASSNAVHVTAVGSSHAIPHTQPALVVEAARQVVEAARATDHTLPACGAALTDLGGRCD